MSQKSDKYDETLFRQDFTVFNDAVKQNDFKTANIISNRIMTNAWFFDEKFFGITGFFLRQLTLDALSASNINDDAVKIIKEQIKSFSDSILGQVSSKKFNLTELWAYYTATYEKCRHEFIPSDEKSIYTTELQFTHNVFIKILKILSDEKDKIIYPSNNLIKGVLNECSRVSRTYGIKTQDLYVLSLLIMIDRIDEYVGLTVVELKDFGPRAKIESLPLVEKLLNINNDITEEKTNEFLWSLIGEWRRDYVRFMDARPTVQRQRKPVIAQEVKEEMVDEFVEGISRELVKK